MNVTWQRQNVNAIVASVCPVEILVDPVVGKAIWCGDVMMNKHMDVSLRMVWDLDPNIINVQPLSKDRENQNQAKQVIHTNYAASVTVLTIINIHHR